MADRLNHIAYNQHGNGNQSSYNFNPRSVSLDIRTPEELAAVNEFLVTLGRDVAGTRQPSSAHGPNTFSPETYFDSVSLSQLGIAGMPGLPPSNPNFPSESYSGNSSQQFAPSYHGSRSNHPSVQSSQYNAMYAGIQEPSIGYSSSGEYCAPQHSRRHSSSKFVNHNTFPGQHYHHPTPPLESSSPHSTVSTPINSTPPQVSLSIPDTPAFDYMRTSRGAPPVAHLAPVDYMNKQMRPIVPLKTAPTSSPPMVASRPEPVEPRLHTAVQRGPPARLTPSSSSPSQAPKHGSLYPLLTSGDIQYRLPPLNRMYRSPSPPSRESTPSSTHSSPNVRASVLPSLRSIASPTFSSASRSAESDELSKEISRIELENRTREISPEERKSHAELIRNLLVSINVEYKERYGKPHAKPLQAHNESSRDVDMVSA